MGTTSKKRGRQGEGGGRPLKFTSVAIMQKAIDEYFKESEEKKKPLTISGLAMALGMTTETLRMYAEKDKFSATVKKSKQIVEEYIECLLISGQAAAGSIFWLKNNAGWKDKTETDVTSGGKPLDNVFTINPVSKK